MPATAPTPTPFRILRIRKVCDRTGLSKTTLYDLETAGKFPKRVKLTDWATGWVESEVDAWLAARAAARTN